MKWIIRIAGGLLVVILLAVAVLVAVGHRAGAGRAHASAELNSSPDRVWPWLNEGEKLKQWVSWLVEVRGTEQAGVGARRTWVMKDENNGGMLMEIQGTCTEYAPPTLLIMQMKSGADFEGQQSYRLTDLGNGRTRLDVDSVYQMASSLARLMEPLITSLAEKKMVGDVAHLKSLVEGGATAAARR